MIQPGSSKLPLSRLQEQGFQPSVRRAVPFVPLYRKASSEDAQQALDDGRDGVRLQKDSHSVTVASSDSAEVLATAMETDPRLDLSGLAKMKGVDQENALKGLKNQTPEKKARHLQMMADNFIAPGDWMGQLAQLQARENVTLFNERTGGLNGRIPTNSELKTLDQKGADHGIDYGYLTDGCYARGHLKCDTLRSEGVNRQKIFVEGSLTVKDGAVTVDGKRTDQHWSYHTAPLVLVEAESGAVEPKVWDPTLAKFRGDSIAWYSPTDWVDGFDAGEELTVKVTDDTTYVPDRWRQGSFETNVADAKKDVEINNLLAQADRFKTETIGPMMDRLR